MGASLTPGYSGNRQSAIMFIDGENLCIRYERMLAEGKKQNPNALFQPGRFIWHQNLASFWPVNLVRVSYYTSVVGTDEALVELQDSISKIRWQCQSGSPRSSGQIVPHVFKKAKGGEKTKSVDINIAIDVLRHTFANDIATVILLAGDGDYIPLLKEVMRQGKQAYVGAFSSGLNPAIPRSVDSFLLLDETFILK